MEVMNNKHWDPINTRKRERRGECFYSFLLFLLCDDFIYLFLENKNKNKYNNNINLSFSYFCVY